MIGLVIGLESRLGIELCVELGWETKSSLLHALFYLPNSSVRYNLLGPRAMPIPTSRASGFMMIAR
jgi:hypothetical protein